MQLDKSATVNTFPQ